MFFSYKQGYDLLKNNFESRTCSIEDDTPDYSNDTSATHCCSSLRRPSSKVFWTVLILMVCTVGGISGSLIAAHGFNHGNTRWTWLSDSISMTEVTLHYNKTFGQAPSLAVDEAWRSIFPPGRGFVQDPVIAPEVSGLAVFHQLHCLNAIREALYDQIEKASQGGNTGREMRASESAGHGHDHLHHVRHCFDYLRQSLMCHADTNLEPVDWNAGGVTGWGSKRTCRDYEQVVALAAKYRTHNQTDIA